MGTFLKQHFNGYIVFHLVCQARACNPAIGSVVAAKVRNTNDLGIHADSQGVLDIIIPRRSAGITSEVDLDTLHVGDTIHVEILGKRFTLNDKKISIIGRCIRDKKKALPTPQEQPVVVGAEPEAEQEAYEEIEDIAGDEGGSIRDDVDEDDEEDDVSLAGGDDDDADEAVVILDGGDDAEEESDAEDEDMEGIDDDLIGGSDDDYGGRDAGDAEGI